MEFIPVRAPVAVRSLPDLGGGVVEKRYAGGWEEVWRALEMIEFFDLDAVTGYALELGSALTVARVGFYLEQHREALMVEDRHLDALRLHAPSQPCYLDGTRESGKLVAGWNLVVPTRVLERTWEEVA